MARADGGEEMPERLTIGTQKAFEENYPFPYEKKQIGSETIYVCTKGIQWARASEVLVLQLMKDVTWIACDSAVSADGSTLQCRQPVFRCHDTDITQLGADTVMLFCPICCLFGLYHLLAVVAHRLPLVVFSCMTPSAQCQP